MSYHILNPPLLQWLIRDQFVIDVIYYFFYLVLYVLYSLTWLLVEYRLSCFVLNHLVD
jgi:hypothetical protein